MPPTSTLPPLLRLVLFSTSTFLAIFLHHLGTIPPVNGACISVTHCAELLTPNHSKKNCSTRITCHNGTVITKIGDIPSVQPVLRHFEKSQAQIDALQLTLARMNATILNRILWLEQNHYNVLSSRVTTVERTVTDFKTTVQNELADILTATDTKVSELGTRLDGEIDALRTLVDGIQAQLRTLETGKVQKLLNHDEIWKKNFKVINNSLNRLGRKNVRVG